MPDRARRCSVVVTLDWGCGERALVGVWPVAGGNSTSGVGLVVRNPADLTADAFPSQGNFCWPRQISLIGMRTVSGTR
jgi:hypothetical protein